MKFRRHLRHELDQWKLSGDRKPLILRGARQVGKTTLIHDFATSYSQKIVLNLELEAHKKFFNEFGDVRMLVEALFIHHDLDIEKKSDTIVFIDEIQESPAAIAMLRYFFEFEPQIHVVAAGSLLEHVFHRVKSFPVGRVQMLHLYPLNFAEFIEALGHKSLMEQLSIVPVKKTAHLALMQLFHQYAIIGGMPEVVRKFVTTKSMANLQTVYNGIWETYKEDVMKYASSESEARVIKHLMSTAHLYVDSRIKFQHFGNSNYKSREISEAFRNLDDARVIQLIYPTTEVEVPVVQDLKKSPRLQFLDTGLINNELNIQVEMLSMEDLNNAYKGAIIPHLIIQELISLSTEKSFKPNFWVREKNQSSAEIDVVVVHGKHVIPIEIKSGKIGKLKSLHQFIQAAPHHYAVRMYAGEFSIEKHETSEGKEYHLMNLPYYMGTKLHDYLEYFVSKY